MGYVLTPPLPTPRPRVTAARCASWGGVRLQRCAHRAAYPPLLCGVTADVRQQRCTATLSPSAQQHPWIASVAVDDDDNLLVRPLPSLAFSRLPRPRGVSRRFSWLLFPVPHALARMQPAAYIHMHARIVRYLHASLLTLHSCLVCSFVRADPVTGVLCHWLHQAAGGGGRAAYLWHLGSNALLANMPCPGAVQAVAFASDRVLTAGAYSKIHHWRPNGRLAATCNTHADSVFALTVTGSAAEASGTGGHQVIVAGGDATRLNVFIDSNQSAFTLSTRACN